MGDTELLKQLLVGSAFFEGIELDAVDVLQQCVAQHVLIRGVTHDGGDVFQACLGGCTPTALTHDELVAILGGAHNDGLQQTKFLDGVNQFSELILIKFRTRLLGIGEDVPDGNLLVGGTKGIRTRHCGRHGTSTRASTSRTTDHWCARNRRRRRTRITRRPRRLPCALGPTDDDVGGAVTQRAGFLVVVRVGRDEGGEATA